MQNFVLLLLIYGLLMLLILFLLICPTVAVLIEFWGYLLFGKRLFLKNGLLWVAEIFCIVILPQLFLLVADYGLKNDCCYDTAFFSPTAKKTAYFWILVCTIAYFYASHSKAIAPPLLEVLLNIGLLIGIALNVLMMIHHQEKLFIFSHLAIIFLYVMALAENQKKIMPYWFTPTNSLETFALKLLYLSPILKFPILLILCLPVLALVSCFWLLFGQKPDALIRMFTDTYRHGLSQWDYKCHNVACDGHFLCSVAAKGHTRIVKPQRVGIRGGKSILCNRQLLIANAFEELIAQRLPTLHALIRRNYNKVGNIVHRYYGIFSYKPFADLIYILMKPLEWFFLLVLYTFDTKPENRIAQQYLSPADRAAIQAQLS